MLYAYAKIKDHSTNISLYTSIEHTPLQYSISHKILIMAITFHLKYLLQKNIFSKKNFTHK